MPTTWRSSPTTTSAVNEKRRPPLTTFATRLLSTTRSWRSRPAELTVRSTSMKSDRVAVLDGHAAAADALGERLDVAVVAVAASIEDHRAHAGRLGALGQQLARPARTLRGRQLAQLGLGPVDGCDRVAGNVVDQLRRGAAIRAEYGHARAVRSAGYLR